MAEYVAKNDTVFNFKFYHKGQTLQYSEALDSNPNFERADGSKPAKAASATGNTQTVTADAAAVKMRAKELKIASWHNKKIDTLLAEIAEAEAKLATPAVDETPADDVAPEAEGDISE